MTPLCQYSNFLGVPTFGGKAYINSMLVQALMAGLLNVLMGGSLALNNSLLLLPSVSLPLITCLTGFLAPSKAVGHGGFLLLDWAKASPFHCASHFGSYNYCYLLGQY